MIGILVCLFAVFHTGEHYQTEDGKPVMIYLSINL